MVGRKSSNITWRRLWPLLPLGIGFALFFALGGTQILNLEILKARQADLQAVAANHYFLAVLGFMLAYTALVACSIPGSVVLTLAGGFLFGTVPATCYIVTAATMGAVLVFLAARSALADLLRARAGPWFSRLADGFERDAWSYMLILRLVPVFPFFVVNLVPAFLGVSLRCFAVTTFFGIIPATFIYAAIGSGLGETLAASDGVNLSVSPSVWVGLVGLGALAATPIAWKRLQRRLSNGRPDDRT
ncbi:TVP38/TMEM64 family protein [Dongia sp.]|uniref:TVP38/TMEM64 family protein n=1 Tax=Dongia sp. TaxID=1977262 RepID=UPI0035B0129D